MYKFLVKKFVQDSSNVNDPNVRKSYGTLASIFGIVSNVILIVIKLIIGLITSSVAIIGDAINNLSDSANSIISLLGFKMSSKPADKDHPYGHGRIEYLATLIISVVICMIGIELVTSSIEKIIEPGAVPKYIVVTAIILLISILIKIYQSWFYYRVGKTINSSTLRATSIDSRNDVIATSAVLIGLVVSYALGFNLDGYLGVIVGLLVVSSGIKLVIESSSPLLGDAPDEEYKNNVINEINNNDMILGVHDLHIHSYGPDKLFGTCHVEVDSNLSILYVHDVIDSIERLCKEKYRLELVIHVDPIVIGDPLTDKIKEEVVNIVEKLPFASSIHDFRVIPFTSNIKIVFDIVIPYDCKMLKKDVKEYIQQELLKINESYTLELTIDN